MKSSVGGAKLERKTVERNRRIHMKNLCFKLTSLLPISNISMTQQDMLDQALSHITALKERVESLKQRHKEVAEAAATSSRSVAHPGNCSSNLQPQLMIRNLGPNLEVNLVCGLRAGFMLAQLISILEQEGADVVTVSFNRVGDRIFHTIHCQAISPRIGLDPSRVYERLKEVVRTEAAPAPAPAAAVFELASSGMEANQSFNCDAKIYSEYEP